MLKACSCGNREALGELVPYVYDELHRRAHRYLKRERQNHTLQTTGLVHEAYLRLIDQRFVDWQRRNGHRLSRSGYKIRPQCYANGSAG